eukprot:1643278-Prymnesium_polylepis.2
MPVPSVPSSSVPFGQYVRPDMVRSSSFLDAPDAHVVDLDPSEELPSFRQEVAGIVPGYRWCQPSPVPLQLPSRCHRAAL